MEKYNHAYQMFNDMMDFAIKYGMTSYQSDLMHDAVRLERAENLGEPEEFLWVVKSNGCGTWLWVCYDEIPSIIADDMGAKVASKYDGSIWTFEQK